MNLNLTLDDELKRIPDLTNCGRALVDFTNTLIPGRFEREGKRWVYRPANFVALRVQHARAKTIVLYVYSHYHRFKESRLLWLWPDWGGCYRKATIESPRQLCVALSYVEQALEFHAKGVHQQSKHRAARALEPQQTNSDLARLRGTP